MGPNSPPMYLVGLWTGYLFPIWTDVINAFLQAAGLVSPSCKEIIYVLPEQKKTTDNDLFATKQQR